MPMCRFSWVAVATCHTSHVHKSFSSILLNCSADKDMLAGMHTSGAARAAYKAMLPGGMLWEGSQPWHINGRDNEDCPAPGPSPATLCVCKSRKSDADMMNKKEEGK